MLSYHSKQSRSFAYHDGESAKPSIIEASKQIQQSLNRDPYDVGEHLSEGLYFVDREPLRAFFTVDDDETTVEIICVRAM